MKHYLAMKNKLEYDDRIIFTEEGHSYTIKNSLLGNMELTNHTFRNEIPPLVSTTKLIKKYFPSYYHVYARRIVESENFRQNKHSREYEYYGCETAEDIMKIWETGSIRGTQMHDHFEIMANLLEMDRDMYEGRWDRYETYVNSLDRTFEPEKNFFKMFCRQFGIDSGKRVFYRTEVRCFHESLLITGSIDAILLDTETGEYIIIDYKRTKTEISGGPKYRPEKSIQETSPSGLGIILPTLKQTRNNSFSQYGCQLTIYKHLFQMMYKDKRVQSLNLISIIIPDTSKKTKKKPSIPELSIINIGIHQFEQQVFEMFLARGDEVYEHIKESEHVPMTFIENVRTFTSSFNQELLHDL